MMLPLSHTWPTDVTDLCRPVSLDAIRKSPATLIPSRVRKQNVVLPVVVNCPVADLTSAPSPLGFLPSCWPGSVDTRMSQLHNRSRNHCDLVHVPSPSTATVQGQLAQPRLIGQCQHPTDRRFSRGVRSWPDFGVSRDGVSFPLLSLSFHQQPFFMCLQALQRRQDPAKYSVAVALALPLPFLSFVFVLLAAFALLAFAFYPASRDPWVQHQRLYPLVLRSGQTASSWPARSSSGCVSSTGSGSALAAVPTQV